MKRLLFFMLVIMMFPAFIHAGSQTFKLTNGWNLTGASYDNISISQFNSSNISTVWKWDKRSNNWQIWSANTNILELINQYHIAIIDNINSGEGFWVNASGDVNITVTGNNPPNTFLPLNSGWNLVALKTDNSVVKMDKFNYPENISTLWKWDRISNNWQIWSPNKNIINLINQYQINLVDNITSGEGFWINALLDFNLNLTLNLLKVELIDSGKVFYPLGITDLTKLKNKISSDGVVAFTAELKKLNPDEKIENIVKLLKLNNRNIEYKKLELQGISEGITSKLKTLRESPLKLKKLVSLPSSKYFKMPPIPETIKEEINKEKLLKINRELRINGLTPLSMLEFISLQKAFSNVKIVDNFGNLDRKFKNVQVNVISSGINSSSVTKSELILNPVSDQLPPQINVPFINSCEIFRLNLPLQISRDNESINNGIISSNGTDESIKFPEQGIAVIVAEKNPSKTLTLKNSDNVTLFSITLSNDYVFYLPVTGKDICKKFTFTGADSQINIKLIKMIKPERISKYTYLNGNDFITSENSAELRNNSTFFNVKSYSFNTIKSTLNNLTFLFKLNTSVESGDYFHYILYSPDGKIYSGSTGGVSGEYSIDNISMSKGIWRVDLLPENSVAISNSGELTAITPFPVNANEDLTTLQMFVSTDENINTKEFMLGIVKNISFKTQGDDGYQEGEVSIKLNTNMSPKLNIPSYMQELIDDNDENADYIAMWFCWKSSEKTGNEFEQGGVCENYHGTFELIKSAYESEHLLDEHDDMEAYDCDGINGETITCYRARRGPYDKPNPTEQEKVIQVMTDYDNILGPQSREAEYLNVVSQYYDLYANWKERTIQVDTGEYPFGGIPYKTLEDKKIKISDSDIDIFTIKKIPVIIPVDRPIFGVPLEKMKDSTLPITFDYSGVDKDDYDNSAALKAFLKFSASQLLNIYTGNFVGFVCDTVGYADDLHQIEKNAEDDPIGSARATINRYSNKDPFYGLHFDNSYSFFMSGKDKKNNNIDTYGEKLNYAQIACGIANIASSGYNFARGASSVINLDYTTFENASELSNILAGASLLTGATNIALQAEEIYNLIEQGKIEEAEEKMAQNNDVSNLTTGTDIYSDITSLTNGYKNEGSSKNGNNVLKTNVHYLLGTGRKTRAEVEFRRVGSVPLNSINVKLDKVKIINNMEDDNEATVKFYPYVGIISDKQKTGYDDLALFYDKEDNADKPYSNMLHYDVADGDELPGGNIYSNTTGAGNVAAIYIELSIIEDDGMGVEDDDMIGVFSKTILMENLFNENSKYKWTQIDNTHYQLKITDYPVYNSYNQLSLENPFDKDNFNAQKKQNMNRQPSALVSFTIDVELGELVSYNVVDTSLNVGPMKEGKDVLAMNMSVVANFEEAGFEPIYDIFDGNVILSQNNIMGKIFKYGYAPYFIKNMVNYDANNFSGDLLPIKEALVAKNSLARKRIYNSGVVTELPLVKLLPENKLLFAISHDNGARLMIVGFDDNGTMSLKNALFVKDSNGNQIYSLLKGAISPDRTKLIIPFIPSDYNSTDKNASTKKTPAHPYLNLYDIDNTSISLVKTLTFGNGDPLTNVIFIDNNHIALTTEKLVFGEKGPAFPGDWETTQQICTEAGRDCLFEKKDENILLYTIKSDNSLELTDTRDIYTTPEYAEYAKHFLSLKSYFSTKDYFNLKYVGKPNSSLALILKHLTFYLLKYENGNYYFYNDFRSSIGQSIRFNEESLYYCANGIDCSGYLSSLLKYNKDNSDVYHSPEWFFSYEFADKKRDLIIAKGPEYNNNLSLINLYSGSASKGPQISGDIFGKEISVNPDETLNISFTVSDKDTPISEITTNIVLTTEKSPDGYAGTEISNIICSDAGECTATLNIGSFNKNEVLSQNVKIVVSDGLYSSNKEFTISYTQYIPFPFTDSNGIEPWKTNGTTSGTKIISDINNNGDSIESYTEFYNFNDLYLFLAKDSSDGEVEPYVTDLNGDTHALKKGELSGADYTSFIEYNGNIFFRTNSNDKSTLWKTDGTSSGTVPIKTFNGNLIIFPNLSNNFIFYNSSSKQLWASDGTESGTVLIKNDITIDYFNKLYKNRLYFKGYNSDKSKYGLWVSDGTVANFLFAGKGIAHMQVLNDYLYFQESNYDDTDEMYHFKLWKTNGTDKILVKDISSNYNFSISSLPMVVCNNKLYFILNNSLWESDGTESGTNEINALWENIPDFNQVWYVNGMKVVKDTIYFNIQKINPLRYNVYAFPETPDNILIQVDSTDYSRINFIDRALNGNLLYTAEDDAHRYLIMINGDNYNKSIVKTIEK